MSAIGTAQVIAGLKEMWKTGTVGDRNLISDLAFQLEWSIGTNCPHGYADADGIRALIAALEQEAELELSPADSTEFNRREAAAA